MKLHESRERLVSDLRIARFAIARASEMLVMAMRMLSTTNHIGAEGFQRLEDCAETAAELQELLRRSIQEQGAKL